MKKEVRRRTKRQRTPLPRRGGGNGAASEHQIEPTAHPGSTVHTEAIALPPVRASGFKGAQLQPAAGTAVAVIAGTATNQDANAMAVMMMPMRQRDRGKRTGQQDGGAEDQGGG